MDITRIKGDRVAESQVKENTATKKSGSTANSKGIAKPGLSSTDTKNNNEKVEWSADAKMMQEAVLEASGAPDIRAEKVRDLKAQIKAGNYKVDANAVAEKMIHNALQEAGHTGES